MATPKTHGFVAAKHKKDNHLNQNQLRKYTEEAMQSALEAARNGMPVAAASRQFGVPRITLLYKFKGKVPEGRCPMGPATVLRSEEEQRLVAWIHNIAKAGFPLTKNSLLDTVAKLMSELNRENPFTNGRPGKKWFCSFMKRHPELSMRTPEKLTGARGAITEAQIRRWFKEVKDYLSSEKLEDVLQHPERVFNADETAFNLCPKTGKVLGWRGQKNIYDVNKASDKENLTVLFTVSAAGENATTLVVYPYKRIPNEVVASFPTGWALGKSDTGWMTSQSFFEYMANVFEPWLTTNKIQRPVLFYVDGHKSHLTMHLSKFLVEHQIILVALYPNATHVLQPLDVAVFRSLKEGWKNAVRTWASNHLGEHVTRINFAHILHGAVDNSLGKTSIKNGFRVCGLYPFDANAVDYTKCRPIPNNDKSRNDAQPSTSTTPRQEERAGVPSCGIAEHLMLLSSHLEFIENQISEEQMAEFRLQEKNEKWTGREAATDLFVMWKNVKLIHDASALQNTDATTVAELPLQLSTSDVSPSYASQVSEFNNLIHAERVLTLEHSDSLTIEEELIIDTLSNQNEHSVNNTILVEQATTAVIETIANDTVNTPSSSTDNIVSIPSTSTEESPFKRALFWPENNSTRKRKPKEKIPAVATSEEWQRYYLKKQKVKEDKEKQKEERKKAMELKRKQKEEIAQQKSICKMQNNEKTRGARTRGGKTRGVKTRGGKTGQNFREMGQPLQDDERNNWVCYKCLVLWKHQSNLEKKCKWVKCNNCIAAAHAICIPKKHYETLGMSLSDSEDEAAFLCDGCANFSDSCDERSSTPESFSD